MTSKRSFFAYGWLGLPLIPLVFSFYLLSADAADFLIWYLCLTSLGLSVWPLAARLFPDGDLGFLAAKPLSLILAVLPLWLLSHIQLLPLRRWSMVLMCLIMAITCWAAPLLRRRFVSQLPAAQNRQQQRFWRRIGSSELLFAAALLFWTFARGLKPDLDSLEKFMNIGFMNSIWRSESLPATDMWMAGETINYYYFGHYLYTYIARLTQIRPEIAYNLAMATTFAMTFTTAYTLVSKALQLISKNDRKLTGFAPAAGGFLAASLLTAGGNSHAFFYLESSPGQRVLRWLENAGMAVHTRDRLFWFADSTRFIGYNPPTSDKTIHEFPYYSFLVADLHAHVINLTFVLLLLLTILYLIRQKSLFQPEYRPATSQAQIEMKEHSDHDWHRAAMRRIFTRSIVMIKQPHMLLSGILLAVFMMCNFWDFAIYIAVLSLLLLYANARSSGHLISRTGLFVIIVQSVLVMSVFLFVSNPVIAVFLYLIACLVCQYVVILADEGGSRTGAQISWLFFLSHLIALPFNTGFEPIAKSISLVEDRTPVWQLFMLWGSHVSAGLICLFLALYLLRRRRSGVRVPVSRLDEMISDSAKENAVLPQNRIDRIIRASQPVYVFFLVSFICGLGLILVPELIYVVDIYTGEFKRANTMFKFTYQAYNLLSLVWIYGLCVLGLTFSDWVKKQSERVDTASILTRSAAGVLAVMLIIPFSYTAPAAGQWLGDFTLERYRGLDGLAPMASKTSPHISHFLDPLMEADHAAINWLNSNVTGQPVILESHGDSYTDFCRISAFTGLPAVIGWQTHQWLWRTSRDTPNAYASVVLPLQEDVESLFTTEDQDYRHNLINLYDIHYIIIGNLERTKFSRVNESADDETEQFESLVREDLLIETGTVVFTYQDLIIIEVSR